MNLPTKWIDNKSRYSSGKTAMVGKIKIGSWHWNGIDRDPNLKYVGTFMLGSIEKQKKFSSEDNAIAFVEECFNQWIKLLRTSEEMTFDQIFEEDGLYVGNDFVEGFCFKIKDGSMYGVQYKSPSDLLPEIDNFHVYKGLFKKTYRKVLTVQSLFKN